MNNSCPKLDENQLILQMEQSIKEAHSYSSSSSSSGKDNELLKNCLNNLKSLTFQLNENSERKLSEKSWNYLIQHFAKGAEFEELAIYWYGEVMVERKVVSANVFTLGHLLRLFSNRGDLEKCEEIFETLRRRKECSLYSYTQYVNACIKRDQLEVALSLIYEMKRNGIQPNFGIFIPMLKAANCNEKVGLKILELIEESNCNTIQLSMSVITFALQLKKPELVLKECQKLKGKMTVVTWTCLMQAYIQMNQIDNAIQLLTQMEQEGTQPDSTTFTILITACANLKLIEQGEYLHGLARKRIGILNEKVMTSIVNLYVKCERPEKAIFECEKMKERKLMNVVSWTCLMQAYIQLNQVERAFELLDEMEECGIKPNAATFTILITASANNQLIEKGEALHSLVLKYDCLLSVSLMAAIVNFYSKCGKFEKAIEIGKEMKSKKLMNGIALNCLVKAHVEMNQIEKAVHLVDEIEREGIRPDSTTFVILITACADHKLLDLGEELHGRLMKTVDKCSIELSTALMNFYTKCGKPQKSIELGQELKSQELMNVITWTCLMQAYIEMNHVESAVELLYEMELNGIQPNCQTFSILITASANQTLPKLGETLHQMALKKITPNIQVYNSILNMYTKCKQPEKAIEISQEMKTKLLMNTISWNCLIQAHIQMNQIEIAIQSIQEMQKFGSQPNSTTFTILLTACANQNLIEYGNALVDQYSNMNLELDNELFNSIINMYVKSNQPEKAIEMCERFDYLMNVVSWNCLIQAYVQMNQEEKAIQMLEEMKMNEIQPDSTSFIILITACANNNLFEKGEWLYLLLLKNMIPNREIANSVMNLYVKCNRPKKAIEIFEEMKQKYQISMDIISLNCLIQAHVQLHQIDQAIQLLEHEMKMNEIHPDSTTFTILITACANQCLIRAEQGEYLHALSLKLIEKASIELSNSIVNFYTKCNNPKKAIEECKKIKEGNLNVISWSCLIHAHIQNSDITSAFNCFEQMKRQKIEPNLVTYTILLSGCGDFVSESKGLLIIEEIYRRGLENSEEIISAMINFYSKVGDQANVSKLFKSLHEKYSNINTMTFNSLLSHYAHNGNVMMVKKLFKEMILKNCQPNDQTFTIILQSFSHSGMINDAIKFFNDLQIVYNHKPSLFNIAAMIDVYSRAGQLDQAFTLIGNRIEYILWNTLMGGCRKFNNIEMGQVVFDKLTLIQQNEASPYLALSQIYTHHGQHEKAKDIRNLMQRNGVKNVPGIVHYEEKGKTFTFISGNSTNCEHDKELVQMTDEIYRKIQEKGFQYDIRSVSNGKYLTEEDKIESLSKHAEKMAITHALVMNPKRNKILLKSNLRICNDCHNFIQHVTMVFNIEIIVRDSNRFHHFTNGKCNCNNYW